MSGSPASAKSPKKGKKATESPESAHVSAEERTALQSLAANPEIMMAMQEQLGDLVGISSGYIESLPDSVKRRLKALKNLQVDSLKVEAKFYEEVHALECKFSSQYREIEAKRSDIICGKCEPTDDECKWELDDDNEEEEKDDDDEKEKANLPKPFPEDVKGVPEFWLTAMKNVDSLQDKIQEYDEPILKHLIDIELVYQKTPGFTLKFHFEPNDYFTDTVLTKTYDVKIEVNEDDPFAFDGPEVTKSTGCKINWNKGKNVTVKSVKKKQKHKGHGQSRTVTKQIQQSSFFNFFSPPTAPPEGGEEEIDQERFNEVAFDYELGLFFRDRLIPKAVLYFTGEATEDDDDVDDDMGDEDDDDDDDDLEGSDPDFKPKNGNGEGKPQECKQQ